MGYTHYWQLNDNQKINTKALKDAISIMSKIVIDHASILAGWDGEGEPTGNRNRICFNGRDDDSHETFSIDNLWGGEFSFCKTALKPYDKVVTACLAVLKHYLGDSVRVSSDGEGKDWNSGVEIASKYVNDLDFEQVIEDIMDY